MRKLIIITSLLSFGGTAMQAALINFDSPPAGLVPNSSFIQGSAVDTDAQVTTQFENLGVVLGTVGGAPYAVLINLGAGHAVSGTNGIGPATAGGNLDYTLDLDIFLVVPGTLAPAVTSAISIRGDEIPSGGEVDFTAYDVNGNLIAAGSATDTAGGTYELDATGIHEFRLHSQHGDVAYDDLSFDTPVAPTTGGDAPEPSTLALFAGGFGMLAAFRCRRTRKSAGAA